MDINYEKDLENLNNLIDEKRKEIECVKHKLESFPDCPKIIRPVIVFSMLLKELLSNSVVFDLKYILLFAINAFIIEQVVKYPFKYIKKIYKDEIRKKTYQLDILIDKKNELDKAISFEKSEFKKIYDYLYRNNRVSNSVNKNKIRILKKEKES